MKKYVLHLLRCTRPAHVFAVFHLQFYQRILSENDIGKKEFYDRIRTLLMEELKVLSEEADLIQSRYDRFRKLGVSAVIKE